MANISKKSPLVKLSLVKPCNEVNAENNTEINTENVRVAFATNDNEYVNQHFGSATQFVIYELSPHRYQLTDMIEFPLSPKGHDVNKLKLRIDALENTVAIYCNAIGSSAIRQLLLLNVKPINVDATTDIKTTLLDLMNEWQNQQDHWLSKSYRKMMKANSDEQYGKADPEQRLAGLLEEDWEL